MTRAELRWASCWAVVVMLITCLPYLYAAHLAPPGTSFLGFMFVADDHCVYLSWEQQAAQGHFLLRNLFTGDAQRGIYIHLFSWLIGTVARFTGLPLVLAHHGARFLSGMVLLVLVYALSARFTKDVAIRRTAFGFTAFSAGFGWLFLGRTLPADLWQPETITFLCLYSNGLFCAALALMVGFFLLMLAAEERQRGARWRRVIGAGLLALLLGNIHSYDVITLAAVWGAYLVVRTVTSWFRGQGSGVRGQGGADSQRPTPDPRPLTPDPLPFSVGRALADAIIAGLVALPSTAYQYYLYCTEPVFQMRADTPTLTPSIVYYLEGYGLVLLLAIGGLMGLVCAGRRHREELGQRLLPMVWGVVGFAVPYLPFSFQRKLVMGLHLPLALLAAVGAVALARWVAGRLWEVGQAVSLPSVRLRQANSLPHTRLATMIVAALLLLTLPTDWYFVSRDIAEARIPSDDPNRLGRFVSNADMDACRWARGHLAPDGVVLCSVASGLLFPAMAGRQVYVGHGSECPRWEERMLDAAAFYQTMNAPSAERRRFLSDRNVRYVYQGSTERAWGAATFDRDACLHPIYRGAGTVIYELRRNG